MCNTGTLTLSSHAFPSSVKALLYSRTASGLLVPTCWERPWDAAERRAQWRAGAAALATLDEAAVEHSRIRKSTQQEDSSLAEREGQREEWSDGELDAALLSVLWPTAPLLTPADVARARCAVAACLTPLDGQR